jgi:hypothetical protein
MTSRSHRKVGNALRKRKKTRKPELKSFKAIFQWAEKQPGYEHYLRKLSEERRAWAKKFVYYNINVKPHQPIQPSIPWPKERPKLRHLKIDSRLPYHYAAQKVYIGW